MACNARRREINLYYMRCTRDVVRTLQRQGRAAVLVVRTEPKGPYTLLPAR
jgi:hypothetical protein